MVENNLNLTIKHYNTIVKKFEHKRFNPYPLAFIITHKNFELNDRNKQLLINYIKQKYKHNVDKYIKILDKPVKEWNLKSNKVKIDTLEATVKQSKTKGGKSELDDYNQSNLIEVKNMKEVNKMIRSVNIIDNKYKPSQLLNFMYKNYDLLSHAPSSFDKSLTKFKQDEIKTFTKFYTKQDTTKFPNGLFIFGENDKYKGTDKEQSGTQAIIRGTGHNIVGIRTCYAPGEGFRDSTLPENKRMIDEDINELIIKFNYMKKVYGNKAKIYLPKSLPGTGVADLPEKAKLTWQYLTNSLIKVLGGELRCNPYDLDEYYLHYYKKR